VIEEAHEVVAAIDAEDWRSLVDELGDLLLQVLLHSRIAEERGAFSIEDVVEGLSGKIVRRHPHVFAAAPGDLASIRANWETIKEGEGRVKQRLPTLLAARKLVSRWKDDGTTFDSGRYTSPEAAEGGRLLEAIAATCRLGIDPEIALTKALACWGRPDQASSS
jgi:XTP/dITP diphosphohydrolase